MSRVYVSLEYICSRTLPLLNREPALSDFQLSIESNQEMWFNLVLVLVLLQFEIG